jgi:membrane protein DedA with SNARE-associated domain
MDLVDIVLTFAKHYAAFAFPVAVVAPLIGGEAAILALAFIAGQGAFSLWVIILGSTLGMILTDMFWFFAPRTAWGVKLKERGRDKSETFRQLESKVQELSHHNDVLILLISKILIGTRILILLYLSMRQISFRRFVAYDSVATFVWGILLGYIGWFAGLGYYSLSAGSHDLTIAGLYIGGTIVLCYGVLWGIRIWINKR